MLLAQYPRWCARTQLGTVWPCRRHARAGATHRQPSNNDSNKVKLLTATTCARCCKLTGTLIQAQAIFPQQDSIAAAKLEPQFQGLTARDGTPINTFTYNKGL